MFDRLPNKRKKITIPSHSTHFYQIICSIPLQTPFLLCFLKLSLMMCCEHLQTNENEIQQKQKTKSASTWLSCPAVIVCVHLCVFVSDAYKLLLFFCCFHFASTNAGRMIHNPFDSVDFPFIFSLSLSYLSGSPTLSSFSLSPLCFHFFQVCIFYTHIPRAGRCRRRRIFAILAQRKWNNPKQ